jgi:hypothetical protein
MKNYSKHTRRPIQKRHALLLEVLLALSLLLLCLFPLVRPHLFMYQTTRKRLEKFQMDRYSQEVFLRVKELLYTHAIPWKKLQSVVSGEFPYEIEIYYDSDQSKKYRPAYTIHCLQHRTKSSSQISYSLLKIDIFFKNFRETKKILSKTLLIEERPTGSI